MTALNKYIGVVALVGAVATAACNGGEAQESATGADASAVRRVVNVEVVTVEPRAFTEYVAVTGVLEAASDVVVAAEESGVIRELYVDKGTYVRAGQAIAKIDDQVLRAQHDQAASEAALAQETFERQRRLWEEERIGTEMNYLRAKYGAQTAAANARVLAARLERTIVRAPVSGTLDDRMVEVGSMVSAGTPVVRIVDADPVEVTAGVPERYAGDIRNGAKVRARVDNVGVGAFEGVAHYVGTALDARTRTFPVEFAIANPNGVLKPGMVAQLDLERRIIEGALLIPREAVQRSSTGYNVYVVTGDGERTSAAARAVELGAGAGNEVVIESGLEPGDRVIVLGQQQVANGDAVRIVGAAVEAEEEDA